jgi:spore coat polysaccharide biosynthesis predicted glycosyltransferase SpsG
MNGIPDVVEGALAQLLYTNRQTIRAAGMITNEKALALSSCIVISSAKDQINRLG